MNSLNILSARVSPPATPAPSRSNSYGNILTSAALGEPRRNSRGDLNEKLEGTEEVPDAETEEPSFDEKTPLLQNDSLYSSSNSRAWHNIPRTIAIALMDSVRWVLSTLAAPGVYLIACLYDEQGNFAPFAQIRKLGGGRASTAQTLGVSSADEGKYGHSNRRSTAGRRRSKAQAAIPSNSSSSGLSSESESDRENATSEGKPSSSRPRTRSQSLRKGDEISPANKTIRIRLHDEENLRQRKHRKTQSTSSQSNGSGAISANDPATLKSPTSPAASASLSITKYPRAPAPPRPLIPRRQPSFTLSDAPVNKLGQKTLILDLDETLIHSMAKGGRMGTGHMIEVRLNTYGSGGNASGSSHPILYWVNKRPHCDEFLRRICKWYNLVIFTASVQEYADPVIDYLEQERKFFSSRYYRQHCIHRQGAYIKDLSSVEPDLSKVMILDNSPLSYMFHQDNAIPIEGWINDPTDNDLLHLIPMLEGLQYVTDVRAFLALRGGEDGKHTMVS